MNQNYFLIFIASLFFTACSIENDSSPFLDKLTSPNGWVLAESIEDLKYLSEKVVIKNYGPYVDFEIIDIQFSESESKSTSLITYKTNTDELNGFFIAMNNEAFSNGKKLMIIECTCVGECKPFLNTELGTATCGEDCNCTMSFYDLPKL